MPRPPAEELPTQLRRGSVGVPTAAFQAFSYVAPAGDVAILLIGTALFAVGSTPLAVLIAWLIYGLWMVTPVEFSKLISNSGSYYAYSAQGFKGGGVLVAWYWLGENLTGPAFGVLGLSAFIYVLFSSLASTSWAWAPIGIAVLLIGLVLSFRGVKPSAGFTLIAGSLEATFLIVTAIVIIFDVGSRNTLTTFTLGPLHGAVHPIFLAVVFSVVDFTGLGTATTLSEETRDSKRKMSRALWLGWFVAGVALIVPSYALTVGWGVPAMAGYAKSADPGLIVYRHYLGTVGWALLIAVTMSSYLSYMVSKVNAVTRIWFSAGRDGIFYGRIRNVNQRFKTPTQAVVTFGVAIVIIDMIAGIILGPSSAALWLLTISGICIIAVHMVANTALTVFTVRERRFRLILHGLIPTVSTIIGGIVIYYSAIPLPSGNLRYAVLVSLAWLAFGFAVLAWYLYRHPEILRSGGISRDAPESLV
jgi:amino acid transporter